MKLIFISLIFIVTVVVFALYAFNNGKPNDDSVAIVSVKTHPDKKVRDSLDHIARKLTGSDFCTLQTTDALAYIAAAMRTEKKYSTVNPDEITVQKRMKQELSLYHKISDSTIKANKWPDSIVNWVNHSSALLDTPCNQMSYYKRMEIIGRSRIKGLF